MTSDQRSRHRHGHELNRTREARTPQRILVGCSTVPSTPTIRARSMPMSNESDTFQTVRWVGDAATGFLRLIDQTRLPTEYVEIDCRDVPAVWEAIKALRVRGAPAIGVAAAYGAVIGARSQGNRRRGSRPPGARRGHRALCAPAARPPSTCSGHWTGWTPAVAPATDDDGPAILDRLLAEAREDRRGRPRHVPGDRPARRTSWSSPGRGS